MLTASAALTSACVKSRLQAKSGRAFSSEMKCERRQSRRLKTSHRLSNVAAPSEKGGGNKVCRAHVNPSFARIRIKREKRKRTRSRSKSGNDSKIQGEAEQGGEHIFCLEPRSGQRFVPLVFFTSSRVSCKSKDASENLFPPIIFLSRLPIAHLGRDGLDLLRGLPNCR